MTKEPLAGVQFELTFAEGGYVDSANGHLSSKGLYTTDENGEIRISGVTGTIVVKETKCLDGYTIDPAMQTQTVAVNPADTQTLTFYNTPTGNFQLVKTDEDSGKRLADCTFEIRRMDDGLVGTYTTDKNGTFSIPLDAGSYYLRETKAPAGYNLLKNDISVTIAATLDKTENSPALTALTISVDKGEATNGNLTSGIVSTNVVNNSGAQLPETGGMGTTIFYVLGGVLVLAAVVLLVTKKRMSGAEK